MLHLHKGTPYVYQGEELGMTNSYFTTIERVPGHRGGQPLPDALSLGMQAEAVLESLSVKGRDNARTPMQWDAPSTPASPPARRGCR